MNNAVNITLKIVVIFAILATVFVGGYYFLRIQPRQHQDEVLLQQSENGTKAQQDAARLELQKQKACPAGSTWWQC